MDCRILFGDNLNRYDSEKTYKQMFMSPTFQTSHVREYVVGDAMNRIHWKMSSRSNELMTKVMDSSVDNPIVLLLNAAKDETLQTNLQTNLQANELERQSAFEHCVQVTASLLQYGRQLPCKMELLCNSSGDQIVRMANRFENGPCNEFLTQLMNNGKTDFTPVVREEILVLPSGSTLICVTSHLDDSLVNVFVERRRRNNPIHIVFVLGKEMPSEQELKLKSILKTHGCSLHFILAPGSVIEQVQAGVVDVSA